MIDGRRYLYFVGTGYLGLQGHPEVIHAACEAARQYGVGSGTTRAGYGTTPPLLAVERLAAQFLDAEAAFHFPSGYAGNQILVAALADAYDAVFLDELSHYCVAEAAQAGGRPVFRFAHCDPPALRKALQTHLKPSERPLVMTDGVFAARGDIAPLAEYRDVLADYAGATLLVDDAHGLGVLGQHGRGTLEEKGVRTIFDARERTSCLTPLFVSAGTLSKALGGYGGIIAGSQRWVERLKTASHWYDGASPLPPPLLAASARALELVLAEPQMRLRLRENVQRLRGRPRAARPAVRRRLPRRSSACASARPSGCAASSPA